MTVYGASPDRLVQGVTLATVAVLLSTAAGLGALAMGGGRAGWQRGLFLVVAVGCVALLAAGWAYRPEAYGVTDQSVLVLRRAGNVTLPIAGFADVRADPEPFAGAIRLAGNGGLFGFWGAFRSERLGRFTAYATRRDRGVVLDGASRRVVVTPDEPARLIADVRARMGRVGGAAGSG